MAFQPNKFSSVHTRVGGRRRPAYLDAYTGGEVAGDAQHPTGVSQEVSHTPGAAPLNQSIDPTADQAASSADDTENPKPSTPAGPGTSDPILDKKTNDPAIAPAPARLNNDYSRKQSDRKAYLALREDLNSIALPLVLEALGALPNQDGDRQKWKIPGWGNLIFRPGAQSWKNVNSEQVGFGGVFLVKEAMGFAYERQAIAWLVERFGDQVSADLKAEMVPDSERARAPFSPPEPGDEDASLAVLDYLVNTRGLPSSLVREEMAAGNIYAGHPLSKKTKKPLRHLVNCVFLGRASGELRSVGDDGFKGTVPGSDPDISGYLVKNDPSCNEKLLALTEAAVDALSYRALFPGRSVLSCNGASRFALQYRLTLEALDHGFGVRLALDADSAGDIPSQKIFNALVLRRTLAHTLGVDEDTVDGWLLNNYIQLHVDPSPHEMVFSLGWSETLPVHIRQTDAAGRPSGRFEPAGTPSQPQTSRPAIRFHIPRALHERLPAGNQQLLVSRKAFDYVTQTLNVRRDRPPFTKDWNAEIKRLDHPFTLAYERCKLQGFHVALPALPPRLQAFRNPGDPVESQPTPPSQNDTAHPKSKRSFRSVLTGLQNAPVSKPVFRQSGSSDRQADTAAPPVLGFTTAPPSFRVRPR